MTAPDALLQPLVVIAGPTAVGKTAVGIELALKCGAEIVSADSMMIYRKMDVGTDKPTLLQRRGVPHHLIDIIDPADEFNVVQYQKLALAAIQDIGERGRLPLLVGGTGLYIRALTDQFSFPGAPDPEIRKRLEIMAQKFGSCRLYKCLASVDGPTAAQLHPNDERRIIRALEVYFKTGKPLSRLYCRQRNRAHASFNLQMFGLYMDRDKLYERINKRVEELLAKGLLQEVRSLLNLGYNPNLISMQGLGYKELVSYIQGNISLVEATEILKRNTRRFAKRQLTWFKRDQRLHWINVQEFDSPGSIAEKITHELAGVTERPPKPSNISSSGGFLDE